MPTSSTTRCLGLALACLPAFASALTLDFETGEREGPTGLAGVYAVPGVTFNNGFVFIDADTDQPERRGSGDFFGAPSKYGALTLFRDQASSAGLSISFATGITDRITFAYSTIDRPLTVQVLDADNNVLAESGNNAPPLEVLRSQDGPLTGGPFKPVEEGRYNNWADYTLSFSGVAKTVLFIGAVSNPGPTGMVLGDFFVDNLNVVTAVPEPATVAMMLAGFAGVGVAARRRRS